ncbi:MAG: DUF1684 domain-containing protein [Vicinamibacterales bacterium]
MGRRTVRVKTVTPLATVLFVAALAAACGGTKPPDAAADYVTTVQAERASKDEAFRRQVDQPIPLAAQRLYLPLKYFPIDPAYAVTASFTPAAGRTPLKMPTSTGLMRDMDQVGTLSFTLKGQLLTLGAFVEKGTPPSRLFVPFTDLTSGTETYAAGRYLEFDRTATGIYTVDFNRAFHPYCYYNESYDCPYPPPSNRLPTPVRAGEKLAQSNIPAAGR